MFTASHNPAQYNGIKLCRAGAAPVGQDSGLRDIAAMIEAGLATANGSDSGGSPLGNIVYQDLLPDYASYLRKLVPIEKIRPLTIVVDAGNGMGGFTVPEVQRPQQVCPHCR